MLDLERIISVFIKMYIMFFKVYKRFWFYRFCLINIKNIVKLRFGFQKKFYNINRNFILYNYYYGKNNK